MSDIPKPESAPEIPVPKQFMMIVEEHHVTLLSRILQGIQFVQIEGMIVKDDPTRMVLVTINPKPVPDQTS